MSHEQSETIQRSDGKWVNVYGRDLPKAGEPLPGSGVFGTAEEAVAAAKKRSQSAGLLDLEEFAGAETGAASPPSPLSSRTPTPAILSAEDFEDAGGAFVPSGERPGMKAAQILEKGISGAKAVGGEAAALADLVLSLPGFALGVGAQLGGTVQAFARGEPADIAYAAGREAGKEFSEPFMSPLHKVMKLFESGEAYEQAATTKGMEKLTSALEEAGVWAERASGGRVSRDAVPMLAETLMISASGLGAKGKPYVDSSVVKRMQVEGKRLREEMEAKQTEEAGAALDAAAAAERPLSPDEFVARVPVQQQINDMLGIRPPEQQAAARAKRLKDLKSTFRRPEEGGDYASIEESVFRAEERLSNEAAYAKASARPQVDPAFEARMAADEVKWQERVNAFNVHQTQKMSRAEAQRILEKPGASRTPAELNALKIAAGQEGRASLEALAMLGAAGLGAVAGMTLDEEALRGAALGAASGMSFVAPFIGRGASVPSKMRQSGAVKAPGGMWHPEAVERLAQAIEPKIYDAMYDPAYQGPRRTLEQQADWQSRADVRAKHPLRAWSDKAIRNYLNRYAGTERDPLKDVEIPFGEGIKSWGELTDQIVSQRDSPQYPGQKEYTIQRTGERQSTDQANAVTSYLSHVGDYLRQNVAPEKLKDYDLVRAVKETAENDKRMAKEMEKAQAASSKDLPTYKEYPDGYRWVELKLPEKLTEEQRKGIRKNPELKGAGNYEALGPDGKPLKNAYTGEIAQGATPEEAYLAGRLAEEGNIMGHCVGGYCEGVASGESRIFSLRDPKGGSHVTVEVEPRAENIRRNAGPNEYFRARAATRGDLDSIPDNINQIKGKQNRAPEAKYLPYVQDFVKGGKWGEVGDITNAEMVDAKALLKGAKPAEAAAQQRWLKALEGDQFLSKSEYDNLHKEIYGDEINQASSADGGPRNRQRGFIDQKLLVGAGALGLGGMVGWALSEDPSGALLGALAGGALAMPGGRARLKSALEVIDYGLGSLSTRIGNLSPATKLRLRDFERRVLSESHATLHRVAPFMQELEKVQGPKRAALERAILTNDSAAIADLMKGNVPLVAAWREVRNVLTETGEKLQGHGRFRTMLEDYFPRLVKDVEGLKGALGQVERTRLEKALLDAERAALKARGAPLTDVEKSAVINQEVQGFRRASATRPGFSKARGVEEITETLRPFYHTPAESLYAYVRAATMDLEMARFFGKDLVQTEVGKQKFTNTEASVGNLVGRELAEGHLDHKQAQKMIEMLQARFQGGERASSRLVQEARNLGNLGLLGNLVSAATQMADSAMAVYSQGLRSTLIAAARQFTGKQKISTKEFGLADHIAEEFVSPTRTAAWLNNAFKYSGFSAIDRFGKNVHIGAALDKYTRWAQSPEGRKRIAGKYEAAYGAEFPRLLGDLKEGRMTERVRSLLFSELSDVQPISKAELPEAYLRNPNGRLVYMLKTFMLKQMDLVRRDAYEEIKKGNVAKGVKNLATYAMVLGLSEAGTQAVKDWLMGRPVDFTATTVPENVLKTFGWSQYAIEKARKGRPVEALVGTLTPPYQMMDDIIRRDPKAVQYVPILGKLYFNWELGGREASEISKAKRSGAELSDRAQEYRSRKREAAAEKREREGR